MESVSCRIQSILQRPALHCQRSGPSFSGDKYCSAQLTELLSAEISLKSECYWEQWAVSTSRFEWQFSSRWVWVEFSSRATFLSLLTRSARLGVQPFPLFVCFSLLSTLQWVSPNGISCCSIFLVLTIASYCQMSTLCSWSWQTYKSWETTKPIYIIQSQSEKSHSGWRIHVWIVPLILIST